MSELREKGIILRAEGISKSFGPTKALVQVSFEIKRGEVVGLIGENGSGKSTFSTIVAGIQKQDEGQLYLNGEPYAPADITDAISKGVAMVVQEQGTFNNISVAANIFAGREQQFTKAGLLDLKAMNNAAAQALEKIGVTGVSPAQVVNAMSFEERKLLEVARAECAEPQLLIIDETTTALGREGRDVMYQLINKMREDDRSVLFISHDIEELMNICDSIIVLRDGHYIGALSREEMTVGALRQMMVGREIADNFYRSDWNGRLTDDVVLSARDICYGPMKDLALDLYRGEILGIGGLTDCGMHDFGKILFGIIKPDFGEVVLSDGKKIANPDQAVKSRMAYISKNRDTEALMSAGSVKDNICLPNLSKLSRFGLISPKREMDMASSMANALSIKMQGPKQYVMYLSGGNKQKVSIGKWLASEAEIYIFDCPTRGIDIGVKADIYRILTDLKNQGKAIIMISEELPELIGMSDRILTFKDGAISGEFLRDPSITEHTLIDYMI